jgi:hypothetical protein
MRVVNIYKEKLITYDEAAFSNGFNVYKKTGEDDEQVRYKKMNDKMSWFKTEEDAMNWIDKKECS